MPFIQNQRGSSKFNRQGANPDHSVVLCGLQISLGGTRDFLCIFFGFLFLECQVPNFLNSSDSLFLDPTESISVEADAFELPAKQPFCRKYSDWRFLSRVDVVP